MPVGRAAGAAYGFESSRALAGRAFLYGWKFIVDAQAASVVVDDLDLATVAPPRL